MIFEIDPHSGKPIYHQITSQVRYALATGRLRTGDRLPSIRELAVQTRVNRNTIAKAYAEMEREGLIVSRTGQGSFVSDRGPAHGRDRSLEILTERIDDLLALAGSFHLDREELRELFEQRLGETNLGEASAAAPTESGEEPTA
jgi:GntR family transcriptional regulator